MYLFFWYKLLPLERNFSILLDSGLIIFQDYHEDALKVLPHWRSLIPHSFGDLPALILKEHTDHNGENINFKKIYSLYCVSVSLFPCVFWQKIQLLAKSCMWLLFCQTIKPVLLKILSLSLSFSLFSLLVYLDFAFSMCSSRLRYERILISITVWFLCQKFKNVLQNLQLCVQLYSQHILKFQHWIFHFFLMSFVLVPINLKLYTFILPQNSHPWGLFLVGNLGISTSQNASTNFLISSLPTSNT